MSSSNSPPWRRLHAAYLFQSAWYSLRQDSVALPSGEQLTYTLIEHPGYALVVPLLDDGRVVMERIYRYPIDRVLLECPSGGLGGEPPAIAARRELEEETGYRARKLDSLGSFYASTGNSTERCHAFLARGLSADGRLRLEATEHIELVRLPLPELELRALHGEIEAGASALALLRAAAYLRQSCSE